MIVSEPLHHQRLLRELSVACAQLERNIVDLEVCLRLRASSRRSSDRFWGKVQAPVELHDLATPAAPVACFALTDGRQ